MATTSHQDRSTDAQCCDSPSFAGVLSGLPSPAPGARPDNRLGLVLRASRLFSRASDPEESLAALLDLLADEYADVACLYLRDSAGRLVSRLLRQRMPGLDPLLAALGEGGILSGFYEEISHDLIASGEALLVSPASMSDRADADVSGGFGIAMQALGASSAVIAPLMDRGQAFGLLLVFATTGSLALGADDRQVVEALARQVALSLENARKRADAHAARAEAVAAREVLARQLTFTHTIVHDMAEGVVAADRCGRVTYLNPVAEQVLGWSIEQVAGRHGHDLFHVRDASGAELPVGECPLQDVYQVDRTIQLRDATFRRSDGTTFPVALSTSPLVRDGEIVGAVMVFHDVTREREARRQLEVSEERLRRALTAARMMIWERDFRTGRTVRSDLASELFGRPNEELLDDGAVPSRYMHPEDLDRVAATIQEAIRTGDAHVLEYRVIWPDGSIRWIARHGQVFHDESGQPVGMRGTAVDIIERKVAELRLERLLEIRQAEAAELHQQLRRSPDAVLGLHEIGKLLTSTCNLKAAARRLLEIAIRAASLECASISLRDRRGAVRLWQRLDSEHRSGGRRRSAAAVWARVQALSTGQVQTYRLGNGHQSERARVGWCVPLAVRDRVIGVLEAVGEPGLVGEPTAEILTSLAAQAASALENSRLYQELAARERALHRLVHQLMSAQEEERRRVALELHDEVAQTATGMQQLLEAFAFSSPGRTAQEQAQLDTAVELARRTVLAIRRTLAGLRPTLLDELGLARGLRTYAESLASHGLTVSYAESLESERLAPDVQIALFRVAQEALVNVRRHAQTSRAELSLESTRRQITLEVRDAGLGFDPLTVDGSQAIGNHLGLLGMRERMTQIGGTLTLISSPGEGTCVRAVAPLKGPSSGRFGRGGRRR